MFAIACRTLVGAAWPGGVAAANSSAHFDAPTTQAATTFARELKVAYVEVSLPLGGELRTIPAAPVWGFARLPAMPAAFLMPYRFPWIWLSATNCANAFAAATVVRSLTTTWVMGTVVANPMQSTSIALPRTASTKRTGVLAGVPPGSE